MIIKVNNIDISSRLLSFKTLNEMNSDSLLIGNAVCKKLELKLDNHDGELTSLLDYPFFVSYSENKLLGKFNVYEKPEKYTGELSLTLFDDMYSFNRRYDTNLNYLEGVTIAQQLDEMSNITGVSIDKSELSESVLNKLITWYDNTISMRNYLGWIAELVGCNVFIGENGVCIFRSLASAVHNTIDVETYEKGGLVVITRICFDDGILKLEAGNNVGNTMYLSSNNAYVDSKTDLSTLLAKYQGLSFYSVKDVKMANIVNLYLTDLVNYNNEFIFMPLSVDEVYSGGQYSIATINGEVNTINQEIVINKIDPSTKIRRLKTIVDQNKQSLQIISQDVDDNKKQLAQLQLDKDKISLSVSETNKKVETLENKVTVSSVSNQYGISTDKTIEPISWQDTRPTLAVGQWLWMREKYIYSNGNIKYDGIRMISAEDGRSGTDIVIEYALSNSSTIPPINNKGRLGRPVIYLDGMDELKKLETPVIRIEEVKESTSSTTAVLGLAVLGQMILGYDPNEPTEHVASFSLRATSIEKLDTPQIELVDITAKLDTPQIELVDTSFSIEWSTTPPTRREGQYIWQRVKYIYADGAITYGEPVCITGDRGDDGLAGKDGKDGRDGRDGQTPYLHIKYSAVENPTSSSDMSEIPNVYMGTYTDFVEEDSDDPSVYKWYKVKGEDGAPGEAVDGKTSYFHVKYSNDAGQTFTSNNGETVGDYMGTYTDFIEADSTNVADYTWHKVKGENGAAGRDAITYQIISSLGTSFLDSQEETTELKAVIYRGAVELDTDGAYGYTWYLVEKDGSERVIGNDKTLSILTSTIAGKGVYFIADDGGIEEEMIQLETPVIELVEVKEKLETPIIYLEPGAKLETPVIEIKGGILMTRRIMGNKVANATSYELFEKTNGTYTSLKEASEINFDVDALNLASGNHVFVVKAKADGYEDSDYSNEVTYTATGGGGDEPVTPTYYTITYKYVDTSGATIKANTTETVAAGTTKTFSTTNAATIDGYTINQVSPTSATINANATVTYTYNVNSVPETGSYWITEKLTDETIGSGAASSMLNTQWFYIDDETYLAELHGKTIEAIAITTGSKEATGNITLSLVPLDNTLPTEWQDQIVIPFSNTTETVSTIQIIELDTPFVVPTGYTLGYRSSKGNIFGGGAVTGSYRRADKYYNNNTATSASSINIGTLDCKVKTV